MTTVNTSTVKGSMVLTKYVALTQTHFLQSPYFGPRSCMQSNYRDDFN